MFVTQGFWLFVTRFLDALGTDSTWEERRLFVLKFQGIPGVWDIAECLQKQQTPKRSIVWSRF
jgi:hypothetical protein